MHIAQRKNSVVIPLFYHVLNTPILRPEFLILLQILLISIDHAK